MLKENKRAYSHLNLGRLTTDKRVLCQLVCETPTKKILYCYKNKEKAP